MCLAVEPPGLRHQAFFTTSFSLPEEVGRERFQVQGELDQRRDE